MNDKYKSCKDCPDRSVTPNCHSTCEGYLKRVEKRKEISKKRKGESDYIGYLRDTSASIKKRFNLEQKNKRHYR